jgi:beta-glucosidase
VKLRLDKRSFAYYNINISNWHIDSGKYEVQIGASSREIKISEEIEIVVNDDVEVPNYREDAPGYYELDNNIFEIEEKQFELLYGSKLPQRDRLKGELFNASSSMLEVREKFIGKLLYNMIVKQAKRMFDDGEVDVEEGNMAMMEAIIAEMPLRSLGMMGGDKLPKFFADGIVLLLNGKFFKGIGMLRKK